MHSFSVVPLPPVSNQSKFIMLELQIRVQSFGARRGQAVCLHRAHMQRTKHLTHYSLSAQCTYEKNIFADSSSISWAFLSESSPFALELDKLEENLATMKEAHHTTMDESVLIEFDERSNAKSLLLGTEAMVWQKACIPDGAGGLARARKTVRNGQAVHPQGHHCGRAQHRRAGAGGDICIADDEQRTEHPPQFL